MIVKSKKERKERHWIPFLLISLFSIMAIYFIFNNNSIRIKTIIPFGHTNFLYLFDTKLYFLIILIIFNYTNLYKTFLLFYSLSIPHFLNSLFCSFLLFEKQNELNLFYNYFLLFFFFLILSQILFDNSNNVNEKYNFNYKGLFIYILIFLILFIFLTNTVGMLNSNIIFLDKIISGFLLSFSCYYFIFYVLNINQKDSFQLFQFINNFNNNFITVSFFILIIISIYLKNQYEYYKYLSMILYIISLIVPVYGIIYEFKFLFNANRKNWANFNFENQKDINNDNINSLISEITITKSIKWNKTSFCIDILRLFALFIIQICFFYLSENFNSNNNFDENKINEAFSFFQFSIFLFIVGKMILYWMKLINMTYFFLERNSINSK